MMEGSLNGKGQDLQSIFEALGAHASGKMTEEEVLKVESCACPGEGSCSGLFTANTMSCLTEALGLSLVGCGTSLAISKKKRDIARATGRRIVELVKEGTNPRSVVTRDSFVNAIKVDMAIGGSTNTALHIPAIANDFGIKMDLSTFDQVSREVPHIMSLRPGGIYYMSDFERAGGVPSVLKRLRSSLSDEMTLSGKTIYEIADEAVIEDPAVIRSIDEPFHKEGGIAILYGNLAPDGSVVKQAAVSAKAMKFTGRARVFDSEALAIDAIMGKKIEKGDVVIIRYEGPKRRAWHARDAITNIFDSWHGII